MSASGIRAHVVKFHLFLGRSALALEEDGFRMAAFRASVILGSRQRRVGDHIGHDLSQSVYFVSDLIYVDARVVGGHAELAIPTTVHENALLFVFFRVEHVVAFLAETNADETGSFVR